MKSTVLKLLVFMVALFSVTGLTAQINPKTDIHWPGGYSSGDTYNPTTGGWVSPSGGTNNEIAQTIVGSPVSNITFSSIPGTYTDMVLELNGQSSSGSQDDILIQINTDTGSHYNYNFVYATSSISGSATNSDSKILVGVINPSSDTNVSANLQIRFNNYAATSFYKTIGFVSNYLDSSGNIGILTGSGDWTATPAAITSVKIYLSSGSNFTAGTTATLYGYPSSGGGGGGGSTPSSDGVTVWTGSAYGTSLTIIGSDTGSATAGTVSGLGKPMCVDSNGGISSGVCYTPFSVWNPGTMSNSQVVLMSKFTVAYTIPSSCSGSYLHALVGATASTAITLYDVTTSTTLCTATFAISGVDATWSGSGGTISVGDVVEVNGPSTADSTLASIGGQILAIR